MSKSVKDILIETKAILKERGRGRAKLLREETCEPCLLGAVGLAAGVPEADLYDGDYSSFDSSEGVARPATMALAYQIPPDWINDEGNPEYDDVYSFNDCTDDDDEVFALIDRAIEAEG